MSVRPKDASGGTGRQGPRRHGECTPGWQGERVMPRCDVCGNDYDKAFQINANGATHTFDSFECAIHRLAPVCAHCGCKVIGHGVEAGDVMYCCASCARHSGVKSLKDRTTEAA